MKIDKLLKRLKKDAAASPQKAGALALMIVVALYFWAPLLGKYLPGNKAKKTTVAATNVILTDDPILAKASVHPASDAAHWDRVRSRLSADQMMVAATHNASWKHPFARLHQEKDATATTNTTPNGEPISPLPGVAANRLNQPKIEPEAAKTALKGVALNTILIGPRDRAAVIRGLVYRVGDVLVLGDDAGAPAIELRVCSIDETGVELAYDQQRLRLERAKPQLSPGDHLRRD